MSENRIDLDRLLAETRQLDAEANRLMAEQRKLWAEELLRRQKRGPWSSLLHDTAPFLAAGFATGLGTAALIALLLHLTGTLGS